MAEKQVKTKGLDRGGGANMHILRSKRSTESTDMDLDDTSLNQNNISEQVRQENEEKEDDNVANEVTTDEMIETEQVEKWKGLNLKMRHSRKEEYDEDDYVSEVIDKLVILLKKWMKKGVIGGVHDHEQKIVHEI